MSRLQLSNQPKTPFSLFCKDGIADSVVAQPLLAPMEEAYPHNRLACPFARLLVARNDFIRLCHE